jgi:ribosomal protein S25
MMRWENKIYHRKPFSDSGKEPGYTEIERPKKLSAIRQDLKEKIARCRLQLRCAGPGISEGMKEKARRDLAKYERQLANLPDEKTHKIKKTYKKMSQDKIRAYILDQIEKARKADSLYISAWDIAHQLNVKPHFVEQVFQQLNVEGILSQPIHHAPHDSNRDPWGFPECHGWSADLYRITYPDEYEE